MYLYLIARDLDEFDVGVLFTFTLIGDLVVTFILTTSADAWGRRRTLIVGGLLKLFAGVAFAFTGNIFVLVLAGTLGVITPTGAIDVIVSVSFTLPWWLDAQVVKSARSSQLSRLH